MGKTLIGNRQSARNRYFLTHHGLGGLLTDQTSPLLLLSGLLEASSGTFLIFVSVLGLFSSVFIWPACINIVCTLCSIQLCEGIPKADPKTDIVVVYGLWCGSQSFNACPNLHPQYKTNSDIIHANVTKFMQKCKTTPGLSPLGNEIHPTSGQKCKNTPRLLRL